MANNLYDTDFSTTTQGYRDRDVKKDPIAQYAMDCPVSSRAPKGPMPRSSRPEWSVKKFATPNTAGTIEGAVPGRADAENSLSNRGLLSGRFQKTRRYIEVSDETEDMVHTLGTGGKDPWEEEKATKGVELQVDVEATFLSDNESVPPVEDTTASTTRGLVRWASNNNSLFTDTNTTPAATFRTPTSSIVTGRNADGTDTTETHLRSILTSIASARKKNFTEFLGVFAPLMRERLASFTFIDKQLTSSAMPVRRWNQKEGEVHGFCNFYRSDFGKVEAMTSFWLDATATLALLLDMDSVEIAYYRGPAFREGAYDLANRRGKWETVWLTKLLNPVSAGKIIVGATA
jgi:hypothetical protein